MRARKNRQPKRLPAIVPRFLKNAVTIGAIPALVGCDKGRPEQHVQPVVAHYVDKNPPVVAAYAPDAPQAGPVDDIVPAVVAAFVNPPPPPPIARDAGVGAGKHKKKPNVVKAPPPPVVAALVGPPTDRDKLGPLPPPAVVAAMVPDQNVLAPKPTPPKKTKTP